MQSPESFYRALGQRIRAAREARGWSQLRLAMELERTHVAVSYWERGVHRPDLWTLRRIEAVTGRPVVQ